MDQDGHTGKSALKPLRIADITDEISQTGMIEARGSHVMLLQLVAAVNNKFPGMIFPQHQLGKFSAERSCRARDQDNLFRPIHLTPLQPEPKPARAETAFKSLHCA